MTGTLQAFDVQSLYRLTNTDRYLIDSRENRVKAKAPLAVAPFALAH
jgi:hypothetical protein